MDGIRRLRENRLVEWSAPAPDGAATAVEEDLLDSVVPGRRRQIHLSLVEFPSRCEVAAVLIRIGIAHHDFLNVASFFEMPPVGRMLIELRHHLIAMPEVLNGLKERDHIHPAGESRLLKKTEEFQNILFAVRHAEHVGGGTFGVYVILN